MNQAFLVMNDDIAHVDATIVTSQGTHTYSNISLSEVATHVGEGTVCLLCKTAWVSFIDIMLPEVKPSLLAAIIPNLVEEFLAEPIESVHWAIAPERQTIEGKTTVAIIQRVRMEQMVSQCAAAGLQLKAIYPDVYRLPAVEDGWSCWKDDNRVYVRQDKWRGFVLCQSEFDNWFSSISVPEKIIWMATPDSVPVFTSDASMINLMQGAFSPTLKQRDHHLLKKSMYALAGAIACYFAFLAIENVVLSRRLSALQAETLALYQTVVPGAMQATSPRVVLSRELEKRGGSDHAFFVLLTSLSQALSRSPGIVLSHLQFEGGQLSATVEAKDFETLDAWTASFKGASLVFKQEGAEQADGHVTARIRLEK